jgi:hypothetical protein
VIDSLPCRASCVLLQKPHLTSNLLLNPHFPSSHTFQGDISRVKQSLELLRNSQIERETYQEYIVGNENRYGARVYSPGG